MLSYCFKCRKKTESKNSKVANANKGKAVLLSKFLVCGGSKSIFIKEQGAHGLLKLRSKKILVQTDIPLVGDILFKDIK